jgi:P pilus assembly chaperone PapD
MEVELRPGAERTVAFEIEAPPSEQRVSGRLLLSVTDWTINEDSSVVYTDPGSQPNSASSWITFSPSAVTIFSGQRQLVRITIKVPADAQPGDYRTALFIQERPPATAPKAGERLIYLRFRYVFTLYVLLPPITMQGELDGIRLQNDSRGTQLIFEMTNKGSRHLRPRVSWSIRDSSQAEVRSAKNQETTVLLPFARLKEPMFIDPLSPGQYEVSGQTDFQDGGPIQSIRRTVEITAPVAPTGPPESKEKKAGAPAT